MAVTLTKVRGPYVTARGVECQYTALLDTVFATGGETIDVTGEFSYVGGGNVGSVDAQADALYGYRIICAGLATAATSSNVLIEAIQSPAKTGATEAAEKFDEATGVDLHTVGALEITIWGKGAIPSSWS